MNICENLKKTFAVLYLNFFVLTMKDIMHNVLMVAREAEVFLSFLQSFKL